MREIDDFEVDTLMEMMGTRLTGRYGSTRYGSCPLAPYTHNRGRDKSKGMSVTATGPGIYNCHGCNNNGTVYELAKLYAEHTSDSRALNYIKEVFGLGGFYIPQNIVYGENRKRVGDRLKHKMQNQDYLVTEELADTFWKAGCNLEYAKSRGVTEKQVYDWKIGHDAKENRITFHVRDWMHRFMGVSGRDLSNRNDVPKWKHYMGFQKESVLYGEDFLDPTRPRAYVVEGFFDVMVMRNYGLKNVLASMGTSLSKEQREKLCQWFTQVIFIPDFDDEGMSIQFLQQIAPQLKMEGKNLERVGIAGVHQNPDYRFRFPKPPKWEKNDYQYSPVECLIGKDPGSFTREDLTIALKHIVWVGLRDVGGKVENQGTPEVFL